MLTYKDGVFYLQGRVDSANAAKFEQELFALYGEGPVVMDISELAYISSAGLRVLMKLRKKTAEITLLEANNEVYDVLEMTGFSEMMTVKRAPRFVSVKDLPMLGQGAHGRVYKLADDMIIKTYYDGSPLEVIDRERAFGKNAFVSGIPCAIAFDVVRTEDGYGVIFEMAGAVSLSRYLTDHPDEVEEYAVKYADLLKTINTTDGDTDLYCNIKELFLERAEAAAEYFTEQENAIIRKLFAAIPDKKTMVHGDYHPGNVMVTGEGELLLIDMADIGYGNPLYDIGGTCLTMYTGGQRDPSIVKRTTGLDYDLSVKMWNILLPRYYGTTDPVRLELLTKRCVAFGLLRMVSSMGMRTELSAQQAPFMVQMLRQSLFPHAEAFCQLLAMDVE